MCVSFHALFVCYSVCAHVGVRSSISLCSYCVPASGENNTSIMSFKCGTFLKTLAQIHVTSPREEKLPAESTSFDEPSVFKIDVT